MEDWQLCIISESVQFSVSSEILRYSNIALLIVCKNEYKLAYLSLKTVSLLMSRESQLIECV